MTGSSPDKVYLVYNGDQRKKIEVERSLIKESCPYFKLLLGGPYKESYTSYVDIHIEEDYSFEAFESVISYAVDKKFLRDDRWDLHIEMIQLASFWMYDELVTILETHLISCLSEDSLCEIHTMANLLKLERLQSECLKLEKVIDLVAGTRARKWGRCPKPGHDWHHYRHCKPKIFNESDWDIHPDDHMIT